MKSIDAVVTWVNGDDPQYRIKFDEYRDSLNPHPKSADPTRFRDSGEIYFCLASIAVFLPFVRKIYLVTDNQTPSILPDLMDALSLPADYVEVIDHQVIFNGLEGRLPTFNSNSIEAMLHRIPGLQEQFIYFNDDVFIARPLEADCFFDDGAPVLRCRKRRYNERRIGKIVGEFWNARFKKWKIGRFDFIAAQQKAAKLVGGFERYYHIKHQPHPMRVSVLKEFFTENPDILKLQVEHRFRHADQLSVTSLANHLEIRHHGVVPIDYAPSLYIDADRATADLARRSFERAATERAFWGCVQSLDKADAQTREELKRHMRGLFPNLQKLWEQYPDRF